MTKIIIGYLIRTFLVVFAFLIILFSNQIIFSLNGSRQFLVENYIITPLSYLLHLLIAALPIIFFFILAYKKYIPKNYAIYFKIVAVGIVPLYYFLPAYLENSPWHQLFGLVLLISNLLVLAFNQDYYEKMTNVK